MANCIMHVGMHSTGTAAIQASLDGLDSPAFLFPRLHGNANHSLPVLSAFTEAPLRRAVLQRHGGSKDKAKAYASQTRQDLDAAMAGLGSRTLVLSGEGIVGLNAKELGQFRAFLLGHGLETTVYAYVRRPAAFVTNALQQRIKDGMTGDLAINGLYRSYRDRLAKFDAVFGQDHVRLRLFAKESFGEGGVAADFLAWTGIGAKVAQPKVPDEVYSRSAMALLYQYHQHHAELKLPPLRGIAAQRLASLISAQDPRPFRLAPGLVSELLAAKADDVAWMEERLGQSLRTDPGQPQPEDFNTPEDLLAPVEGAREMLLETLGGEAAGLTKAQTSNVYRLMAVHARSAAKDAPAVAAKPKAKPKAKRADDGIDDSYAGLLTASSEARPRGLAAAAAPSPMVNAQKNLMVLWSPKSACTTAYVWFAHVSGFLPQVRKFAAWPHKHRVERYQHSKLYFDSVKSDLSKARTVRIIRDPYGRAVSIYRHALLTRFADKALSEHSNGRLSLEAGLSFQDFLDFVGKLDMKSVDIHFRPQFHPFEVNHKPDRVINISKEDLFAGLNAFERDGGWPETDFQQFSWLHDMEGKRKAHQAAMEGEAHDRTVFSRHQVAKLGQFPSYGQLLTNEAKQKIEAIYKADFDAYRDYL